MEHGVLFDEYQTLHSLDFGGEHYRRNRRTSNLIDTRFGAISFERWFFQNTQRKSPEIASLDGRLGIVARRMTPAPAEVTGRLAADLPQQTLEKVEQQLGLKTENRT